MSSIFQQYSQPPGRSPHCILTFTLFSQDVLCNSLDYPQQHHGQFYAMRMELVVIPLPNHTVALYHLAPQKLLLECPNVLACSLQEYVCSAVCVLNGVLWIAFAQVNLFLNKYSMCASVTRIRHTPLKLRHSPHVVNFYTRQMNPVCISVYSTKSGKYQIIIVDILYFNIVLGCLSCSFSTKMNSSLYIVSRFL